MSREVVVSLISPIAAGLILLFISWWLDIPLLKSQLQDLKSNNQSLQEQMSSIRSECSYMEGFLAANSNFNYRTMVATSIRKNLPQATFTEAVVMLEKKPKEGEAYLVNKLGFTHVEAKAVLNSPNTLQNSHKK